ncbi:MAG TPA: biopolymer transporter ExbD [Terrimicrobiaceae bacterium]
MKLRRSSVPHPVLIVFAPALALALLLIFFLLLSTSFMLQPGIAVNVPLSPFLLSPQRNPRIISVTAPPLSAIFFDNEEVDLTRLREALQELQGRSQTIIVKADKRALYENVSAVLNVALATGFPVVLATAEERVEDL